MATKIIKPSIVFIANKNKHNQPFPIYKQNFNYNLKPADSISFKVNRTNELFFYDQLEVDGLEVGFVDPIHIAQIGNYNTTTSIFTEGGTTYSIIGNGTDYRILGTIPFKPANATLGLAKGNRLDIRLTSDIKPADLPSGKIVQVTNVEEDGYNEYTKAAFETDGSLICVSNVSGRVLLEIKVKWTEAGFTTYTFDVSEAVLEAE